MRACSSRRHRDLLRYLDGQLSTARALALEEHLPSCPRCQEELCCQQRLEDELQQLPRPLLTADDRERLVPSVPTPVTARRRLRPSLAAAAAAAGLMVTAFGAGLLLRDRLIPAPTFAPDVAPRETTGSMAVRGTVRFVHDPDRVLQARADLVALLSSLPDDDPTDAFLHGAGLRGRGPRSAVDLLERHLDALMLGEEAGVARTAAGMIADLARRDPTLVSSRVLRPLERALEIPDRAPFALTALANLDSPRARRALVRAAELPHLQRHALLQIAARPGEELHATKERLLVRLLRQGDRQPLLTEVLARLPASAPSTLRLAATLHAEGLTASELGLLLARLDGAALEAWRESLGGQGPLPPREAVTLAGVHRPVVLIPALLEQVRQGDQAARSVAAVAAGSDVAGALALLDLAEDPDLPQSRQRLALEGLRRALEQAPDPALLAAAALQQAAPTSRAALLRQCAEVPGPVGTQLLLALVQREELPTAIRTGAGLLLAERDSPPPAERLVQLLQHQQAEPAAPDLVCSLLLALYRLDGTRGLSNGCRALKLELSPAQEVALRDRLRRVPTGDPTRAAAGLARVADLLPEALGAP